MNDKVAAALKKVRETDEARTKALEQLAAAEGHPTVIDANDQAALNANVQGLAEGTVIAIRNPGKKRRALKPNEIDRNDGARKTQFMNQIAAGLMVVVDPNELPYDETA